MRRASPNRDLGRAFLTTGAPPGDDLQAGLCSRRMGDEGIEPPTSRM